MCLVLPGRFAARDSRDDRTTGTGLTLAPDHIHNHTLTYYPALPGFDSSCVDLCPRHCSVLRLRLRLRLRPSVSQPVDRSSTMIYMSRQ